jgi:hypothetical protein
MNRSNDVSLALLKMNRSARTRNEMEEQSGTYHGFVNIDRTCRRDLSEASKPNYDGRCSES